MVRIAPWVYIAHVTTRPLQGGKEHHRDRLLADFEVVFPTRAQLLQAAQNPELDLDVAWIEAALDRGDLCTAVYLGGEVVGYTWNSFTTAPHLGKVWVRFSRPYRYGYKTLVVPSYRGIGINRLLATASDQFCIDNGFGHTIAIVETHNFASKVASKKADGRRFIGFAGYLKVGGREITFRSPGAARYGFSLASLE